MKTKAEHMRRAVEVCKADLHLSCGDLTLLVNACVEAAEFRREHSKLHAEKYEAMAEQLRESKKQCS